MTIQFGTSIHSMKRHRLHLYLTTLSLLVITTLGSMKTLPTQSYRHSLVLSPGVFTLYWNPSNEQITFEVHVKTKGYVAFGISPTGGMRGADMMVAWVKDGKAFIQDRYAVEESEPLLDQSQDWRLVRGYEDNGFTVVQFQRALDTCDGRDLIITEGTMRIIWSFHDEDVVGGSMKYHGPHRGSRSIQLLTSHPRPPDLPPDAFSLEFTNPQILVPDIDTTYWCQYFKTPLLQKKHHVVMFEPIIHPPQHKDIVHHIILYGCYGNAGDALHHLGTMCYQDQSSYSYELTVCSTVLFAWAIGGGSYRFPVHVGYPLGGNNYPDFIRMETHYDNPTRNATFVDSSGLRLWLTPALREYDAGILETGLMVNRFHVVPPGDPAFTSSGYCLSNCLSEAMPGREGMYVFATFLHTHMAGRATRVRHVRQGYELPPIVRDEQYDFNFQETRTLSKERLIKPEDDLIIECQYSTLDREKTVYGGLSTKDEMCLGYFWYYPRINLTNCQSTPLPQRSLKIINAKTSVRRWGAGSFDWDVFVMEPAEYGGLTLAQVAERVTWTAQERKTFQHLVTSGRVISRCQMGAHSYESNHQILHVPNITRYQPGPRFRSCAPTYSADMASASANVSVFCTMTDPQALLQATKLQLRDYDFIRFTFPDIHGISRGKLIPARHAVDILEEGTGVFGGLIASGPRTETYCPKKVEEQGFPNAAVVPDLETFHALPWAGEGRYKVGQFLCDTKWLDMSFQQAGPRYVARRQIQNLDDMGIRIMSAYELEFSLLYADTLKPVFEGQDYFCNNSMREFEPFLFEVDKTFYKIGVDLECMHLEHAPGQFEAVMKPAYGIKAADDCFLFKHGLKELASNRNYMAHFMAKENPKEAGCGLHYNFSLWDMKTGNNVFSDLNGPDKLSDFARHWIAGLTVHGPALAGLCAPTINCYRRYHQPSGFAPDYCDWNIDDRTTSFRIKNLTPPSTYMENRLPSGLCNPYLVVAGTVAAGLDGVRRKLTCPPKGRDGVAPLPYNLAEALTALEKDTYLTEALGEEFVDWFCGSKREVELKKFKDTDITKNDPDALAAEFAEYAKFC